MSIETLPRALDFTNLGNFIGGRFLPSQGGESIQVYEPATGELLCTVHGSDKADIDAAVAAARDCFDRRLWTDRSPAERAQAMWGLSDLLAANAQEFAELEVRDNGMPIAFAHRLVAHGIESLRFFAGMVTKIYGVTSNVSSMGMGEIHAYTLSEPIGVVAAIIPWNGPIAVLVGKIAPAIAAGCSIVVKPAEQTPLTALRFAKLLDDSKLFPDGLINIVNGYGAVAGAALGDHPGVDKITFTGSTRIGKSLIQASAGNLKRLSLELGGKSPVFIFADAEMEKAVFWAAMAIFANSGQVCFAGSRLFVQESIYDQFIEGVAKVAVNMKLGNGLDPATQIGPLISDVQMKRVLSYVESGQEEGAELVTGGKRVGDRGYFVSPTVFSNRGRADIRIVREEIFGPVVTAMPFSGIEEVEALANNTEYGLGAGVFTTSVSNAHKAAKLIRSGSIWINCYGGSDLSMPFGGFKQSGWGREGGAEGIAAFLESKAVYTAL